MPVFPGMLRHYDAIGLTDGYVAFAEYSCEKAEDGMLAIFTNRCGVRNLPVDDIK
jgi:hypothetical protein